MEIFVLKEGNFFLCGVSKSTHTVTFDAEEAWWTASRSEAEEMEGRPALKCQSHRLRVTPWELCPETQKPRPLDAWKIDHAARSVLQSGTS